MRVAARVVAHLGRTPRISLPSSSRCGITLEPSTGRFCKSRFQTCTSMGGLRSRRWTIARFARSVWRVRPALQPWWRPTSPCTKSLFRIAPHSILGIKASEIFLAFGGASLGARRSAPAPVVLFVAQLSPSYRRLWGRRDGLLRRAGFGCRHSRVRWLPAVLRLGKMRVS